MRFTVLRSKKLFHVRFVTNNINLSIVNYMPATRQWEIQFNVWDASTLFFLATFKGLKTWFELLRVKLCRNDLRGNKNYMYFELARGSS